MFKPNRPPIARRASTATFGGSALLRLVRPVPDPSDESPAPALAVPVQAPLTLPRSTDIYATQEESWAPSRGIAVSTRVMQAVGDAAAGIFLSQLIYWSRRTAGLAQREGWVFKTADDLQREIGMSWKVQRRARQILVAGGWLEERKLTMPARLEFRLKLSALTTSLGQFSDIQTNTSWCWEQLANRDERGERGDREFDRLLGRSFLFHGSLVQVMPLSAAVLASRLESRPQLYPGRPGSPGSQQTHWLRLQRHEWKNETGLSRDQWQTARKTLCQFGVLHERSHNFPRRIDMAVDPVGMSLLLADCRELTRQSVNPGKPRDRLKREKQAGGFGRYSIHPRAPLDGSPVSPESTGIGQPNQPVTVARNNLYLNTQLPTMTLQLPQRALPATQATLPVATSFAAFGVGGGLNTAIQNAVLRVSYGAELVMASRKSSALIASAGLGDSGGQPTNLPVGGEMPKAPDGAEALNPAALLHWPKTLQQIPAEIGLAMRHLAGLKFEVQQAILDEIVFIEHYTKREVRNHLGLLRTLCGKARDGKFNPEGAHKVAHLRAERLQREALAVSALAAERAKNLAAAEMTEPTVAGDEARKRMNEVRDQLKRRAFG